MGHVLLEVKDGTVRGKTQVCKLSSRLCEYAVCECLSPSKLQRRAWGQAVERSFRGGLGWGGSEYLLRNDLVYHRGSTW